MIFADTALTFYHYAACFVSAAVFPTFRLFNDALLLFSILLIAALLSRRRRDA